jgi:hypothetical protein
MVQAPISGYSLPMVHGEVNSVKVLFTMQPADVIGTSASGIDSIPATTWATMFASYPELFPNGRLAYKANPNNVSSLFNTGNLFENSIGLNGGEGNTLFNVTLSRVDQKGYITNSSYNKNNISVGGQTSIGKLTIGASVLMPRTNR